MTIWQVDSPASCPHSVPGIFSCCSLLNCPLCLVASAYRTPSLWLIFLISLFRAFLCNSTSPYCHHLRLLRGSRLLLSFVAVSRMRPCTLSLPGVFLLCTLAVQPPRLPLVLSYVTRILCHFPLFLLILEDEA